MINKKIGGIIQRLKRWSEVYNDISQTVDPDYIFNVVEALKGRANRHCPICHYKGPFIAKGIPIRLDAWCPKCRSVEKHRLLWLTITRHEKISSDAYLLHFAPEPCLTERLSTLVSHYTTTDFSRRDVHVQLNIESLDLPDNSYDAVVCNHVLEHVDHCKGLAELHRILRPGGRAFLTVPLIEGWEKTYENTNVKSWEDREIHFGQHDHLRYFGRDFRCAIVEAGFTLREYTAFGEEAVHYGLLFGEKVFVAAKSN